MAEAGGTAPAGWYADPYGATVQRYWDGAVWTAHVARQGIETLPSDALAHTARAARWARPAFLLEPVLAFGAGLLWAWYLHDLIDRIRHHEPIPRGLGSLVQVPAWGMWVLLFAVAFWSFRAAESGRRLGIPQRREPGWALASWLVPVVNYWFPVQNVRRFVSGDALVPRLWWWWTARIVESAAALAVSIVGAVAGVRAALPVLAIETAAAAVYGVLGWGIVARVAAGQEGRARTLGLL